MHRNAKRVTIRFRYPFLEEEDQDAESHVCYARIETCQKSVIENLICEEISETECGMELNLALFFQFHNCFYSSDSYDS